MAKNSLKRKNAFFTSFDAKDLINKIESVGGNVKPALEKAAKQGMFLCHKDMLAFIKEHHVSGETEDSLLDPNAMEMYWGKAAKKKWVGSTTKGIKGFTGGGVQVVGEEDVLFCELGFDVRKGGLPALFLDIGTPTQKPFFFIYYAVENNLTKVHAIQKEELMKILKGLE